MVKFWKWLRWLGIRRGVDAPVPFPSQDDLISPEEYYTAWQKIVGTADGIILIRVFCENYLAALQSTCPPQITGPQERSEWLAAHEAIISARGDILRHAVENVNLLPETLKKKKALPSVA